VCNFDWREKLADRVSAVRRYATPAYAQALEPSAGDIANWQRHPSRIVNRGPARASL